MTSFARLSAFAQKAAERTVEAQSTMLNFAAKQNEAASELIRKQANAAGTPIGKATQSIESGMAMLIETNREFLDTASKLAKSAGRA